MATFEGSIEIGRPVHVTQDDPRTSFFRRADESGRTRPRGELSQARPGRADRSYSAVGS